jgi:hypothetical protein
MNKLYELFQNRFSYADQDRDAIESLHMESATLESFNSMKNTEGWKILDEKIRNELRTEIFNIVKDNLKVKIYLDLLTTVETKESSRILEEEIDRIIPK